MDRLPGDTGPVGVSSRSNGPEPGDEYPKDFTADGRVLRVDPAAIRPLDGSVAAAAAGVGFKDARLSAENRDSIGGCGTARDPDGKGDAVTGG